MDSLRAFQVPELVLHLFSILRTHDTDTKAFVHANIASIQATKAMNTARTSDFEEELRREGVSINRLRSQSSTPY